MTKNETAVTTDSVKETLASVNVIAGVLTKLAAVITGLSALAIISGWKKATTYYQELGAPWVTSMLSPVALFQYSAQHFILIGSFAFLTIYMISEKSITERQLRLISIICIVTSFLIFTLIILPTSWFNFSPLSIYGLNSLITFLIILTTALSIGVLVANLSAKKLKWNDFHIFLIYIIITLGFWQTSEINGTAKAEYDGNLKTSGLPLVSLTSPVAGKEWRLVTNIDSSFLVVSLAETKGDRVFRMLSASEISSIKSTRSK
jgi:hypothetical protein